MVAHFKRLADGKRGVTFYPDVETAAEGAKGFGGAGIPAAVVSANTQDRIRADSIARLKNGSLRQLTNVDIFGEGFDLPAIDAVSLARHTKSFALFCQQVGRAMRPVYAEEYDLSTREGRLAAIAAGPKPYAIVIDHVGNVKRHAVARELNDGRVIIDLCYREWSLDGRDKKPVKKDDEIDLTTCLNPDCLLPYARVKPRCPYCQEKPVPARRDSPEFVDGDLTELDPTALGDIVKEKGRIDGAPRFPVNATLGIKSHIERKHTDRQQAQTKLREAIAWWAAWQRQKGRSDAESYRRFWYAFGVDVLTAQTLGTNAAAELAAKIEQKLAGYYR